LTLLAYSPGALSAAAKGDRAVFGIHDAAIRSGIVPCVSALAILEVETTAKTSTRLGWILSGCEVRSLDSTAAADLVDRRGRERSHYGLWATERLLGDDIAESAIVVSASETRFLSLEPAIGRLILA
jgi:hypothetical protein